MGIKRRSSKGNPYHVPKGSPKGGQFTSANCQNVEIRNSQQYYDAKTQLRNGEISEEEFQRVIKPVYVSKTPSYDLFVESLPQKPDVSTHQKKTELFKKVVGYSGEKVDVPVRQTKGKQRIGCVSFALRSAYPDDVYKEAQKVTLSNYGDNYSLQVDTVYHEAFHYCSNGGITDEYDSDSGRNKASCQMEEVMAVSAAYALTRDTGYTNDGGMSSYTAEMVETLPRLKHNTERYKDCNTIADVGRIAWDERLCDKSVKWMPLHNEAFGKPLPRGYYKQYVNHLESNKSKYIDEMVSDYMKKFPTSKENEIRQIMTDSYFDGLAAMKNGVAPNQTRGNTKVVINNAVLKAIHEIGIL